MSFLKPTEFANLVGVKYTTLRGHISRGKVIKKEGYIDTEHPQNVIYIKENSPSGSLNFSKSELSTITNATDINVIPESKKEVSHKSEAPKESKNDTAISNLTLRKKRADVLKVEKEAELKQLQIQKLMGQLMPIDMVEKIVTINITTIFRTMESDFENMASIYCERLGGDRTALTDIMSRMRESLSRVIANSKKKSQEEIDAVIDDYSDTRSRGERK